MHFISLSRHAANSREKSNRTSIIRHAANSREESNRKSEFLRIENLPMENEIPSTVQEGKCTPNDHCWPDKESLGLNESQMRAFKMALTKRLAVIQGPPGTGKTYVGWKIARVLLKTLSLSEDAKERTPILMVSYTNHALDQFLEGVLSTTKSKMCLIFYYYYYYYYYY